MDDARPGAGLPDLRVHPPPDVGVRAVPVAGQLGQDRAELADPLGALLADQAAPDHLHLRAMGHGHRGDSPSCRAGGARAAGALAAPGRVASCPAASSDARAGSGGLAVLVRDGRAPGGLAARTGCPSHRTDKGKANRRPRQAAAISPALSLAGAYASGPGRGTRTTPNPSGSASVTARVLQYGFAGSTGSAPTRLRVASTASASPR